jgi:Rrf2 family protein
MLMLTRKTEYALIAITHLARVGKKVVSARDISNQHHIPLPLLMNVLKRLNRTGHVNSVRGARGGYVLAMAPGELTLAALIEAIEGPLHLTRCTNPAKNRRPCEITKTCPVRPSLVGIHHRLREFLGGITIADLAFNERHRPPVDVAEARAE